MAREPAAASALSLPPLLPLLPATGKAVRE